MAGGSDFCLSQRGGGIVPNPFFYCKNLFIRLKLGYPKNFSLIGGLEVLQKFVVGGGGGGGGWWWCVNQL